MCVWGGVLQNYRRLLPFAEISQYQKIVAGLMEVKDEMTKEVETEKMKVRRLTAGIIGLWWRLRVCLSFISVQAIGARELLKTAAKQREARQQQLQALIAEKRMQHER